MGGFIKAIAPIAAGFATGGASSALTPALITAGATIGSTLLASALAPKAPQAPDFSQITFPTSEIPQAPVTAPTINPDQVTAEQLAKQRDLKRRQAGQIKGGGLLNNAPTSTSSNTLLGA